MDELQSVMEAYDKSFNEAYQIAAYRVACEMIVESKDIEQAKDWAMWAINKSKETANVGSHPDN